jgi:hypothetical protein
MPKISSFSDLRKFKTPDDFHKEASPVIKETVDVVNGKLEFDQNLNTQTVSVVFKTANSDVAVSHNLKKTGVNYLTANKSVNCTIFNGTRPANKNTIYLQCNVPATVTLVLF